MNRYWMLLVLSVLSINHVLLFGQQNIDKQISAPLQFPQIIHGDIGKIFIGKDISEYNINIKSLKLMVSPSSILPFFVLDLDGYIFFIAYSADNIVRAIIAHAAPVMEKQFETPENIFIGMEYGELLEKVPDIQLVNQSGFGYTGRLPSGWIVLFAIEDTTTDHFPGKEDKITSIYLE